MRPFLKWAGGKYKIVERIQQALPNGRRLVEPFVGSGTVFLNTEYDAYLLADVNADLITLYQTVQQHGESFIDICAALFVPENNDKKRYYAFRSEFNQTADPIRKSALFLYLNRHCFNGLCRYNSKGEFNVPFGRYKRPYFPRQEMRYFHQKSARATFVVADFETVMQQLKPGDVVYCDPPYVPLSATANFTSYSADKFTLAQQARLAELAEQLANRGIPVLISNHDTPLTQAAYKSARITTFQVQRHISCNGAKRNKADELLAMFEAYDGI